MEHKGQIKQLTEIPKIQYTPKKTILPLSKYKQLITKRNEAIFEAYASGSYSMKEIGEFFELHYSRISKEELEKADYKIKLVVVSKCNYTIIINSNIE